MSTMAHDDLLLFTPVPAQRVMANGWSAGVQRAFVANLRKHGVAAAAARSVGRSVRSAWGLRRRAGAEGFAAAWDAAVEEAHVRAVGQSLSCLSVVRQVPVFHRGRQVGLREHVDNRLLHSTLRAMDRLGQRRVVLPPAIAAAVPGADPETGAIGVGAVNFETLLDALYPETVRNDVARPRNGISESAGI